MRRILPRMAWLAVLVCTGCVSPLPMAFRGEPGGPDSREEGVALLVIETSNELSDYEPRVTSVEVSDQAPEPRAYHFYLDESVLIGDPGSEGAGRSAGRILHFTSMSLPPGCYRLSRMVGVGMDIRQFDRPVFVRDRVYVGNFRFPLDYSFTVTASRVSYAGRLTAKLRHIETAGDFRAGAENPEADQLASGFFRGTFDLKLTDGFEEDVAAFRKRCPDVSRFYVDRDLMKPAGQQ
jgi:hypothetical protein